MKKVKITAIRKNFYPDFADEYLTEGRDVGACPFLEEGDTFFYEGSAIMPEGFCPWAWVDIYRTISSISAGATSVPWINKDFTQVVCCTDGVRPVTFLVEATDETCEE